MGVGFLLVLAVSLLRIIRVWPYSVSLLVKVLAFLCTLHWLAGDVEFGVGGVSFVELLILCEQWAGERLILEVAVPKSRRVRRPNFMFLLVQALIFGVLVGFFGCYFSCITYAAWWPW